MRETDVYTRLGEKLRVPRGSLIPEILSKLVTSEEGEMLLVLPAAVREVAAKFHLDENAARTKLEGFVRKGVVFSFIKEGQLKYFFARSMGQLSDATSAAAFNSPDAPFREAVLELWEQNRERAVETVRQQGGVATTPAPGTRFRVIPMRAALKDDTGMLPYEDTEAILRNAPAIGVVNCPCRMYQSMHGLNDKPLEVCLQLTAGSVKYAIDQGIGRVLTLEEGFTVLRLAEEAGLVASVFGGERLGFICHCDGKGCGGLRVGVQTGRFSVEKSRYQSGVDQQLCNGCQTCIERCVFGAVSMVRVPGSKRLKAHVDLEKCYGCGACVIKCPVEGAVSLRLVRPKEHIPLVRADHLQV